MWEVCGAIGISGELRNGRQVLLRPFHFDCFALGGCAIHRCEPSFTISGVGRFDRGQNRKFDSAGSSIAGAEWHHELAQSVVRRQLR